MTAKQITKALTAGGIAPEHILDVERDGFTVGVVDPEEGYCEWTASEAVYERAAAILSVGSAYRTGCNAWRCALAGSKLNTNRTLAHESNILDQIGVAA